MPTAPSKPLTREEIAALPGMTGASPDELTLALELSQYFGGAFIPDLYTIRKISPKITE